MQDRFERASGHAYSAGQSYLGVEQTVLDLIVGLESSMSGRIGDQLLYNSEFSKLSQFDQVVVQTGAAFNQAIEGFQGLLSLGGAILNDTGGPNGLTNRAINAVGDGWEMADFIQQDQRLVDAVVRYGKQYIPSMPVAEQGGAAIGLVGTFGTGAALKGLQAIKASENLSGLFDKFSDAVSRAQMPVGLELQAGRLYSGFPLDAVKWKGFVPPKQLLQGEGQVAPYKVLQAAGTKGDNITPHHIPSANHMAQHGVSKREGISINMEQPSPGVGGRHRQTFTYGTKADVDMSSRDALATGVRDARRIYQQDGLYDAYIRRQLQELIRQNQTSHPEIFRKP
jgi:hypothetical protein